MDASDSYLVVERMIHAGEVELSELDRLLNALEDQRQITPSEHESLLALARKLSACDHASP